MLFHISVTRGALNSFVLFAQLITTTFDITGDGTIPLYSSNSQKAYQVLYNFWNLDFFISVSHEFCLSPKLNTMTVQQQSIPHATGAGKEGGDAPENLG